MYCYLLDHLGCDIKRTLEKTKQDEEKKSRKNKSQANWEMTEENGMNDGTDNKE